MDPMTLIRLLLLALKVFNGKLSERPECPGGICDETAAQVEAAEASVSSPSTASFTDFFKCLDFARTVAAVQELIAAIMTGFNCDENESGSPTPQ